MVARDGGGDRAGRRAADAVLPLAGQRRLRGGVVLVLCAASMLWSITRQARGRFTRPFLPWLAAGLGTLAVGIALVLSDIGISALARARYCFVYLFVNWWGLGLLLLCAALFLFTDHRPRRLGRHAAVWLCAVVATAALGSVLVVRHGGFELLLPGTREQPECRVVRPGGVRRRRRVLAEEGREPRGGRLLVQRCGTPAPRSAGTGSSRTTTRSCRTRKRRRPSARSHLTWPCSGARRC